MGPKLNDLRVLHYLFSILTWQRCPISTLRTRGAAAQGVLVRARSHVQGARLAGSGERLLGVAVLAAQLREAEPAGGRRHAGAQRTAQHVDDSGALRVLRALLELGGAPQQCHGQVHLQTPKELLLACVSHVSLTGMRVTPAGGRTIPHHWPSGKHQAKTHVLHYTCCAKRHRCKWKAPSWWRGGHMSGLTRFA